MSVILPQVITDLKEIWEGLCQSVIVEQANQRQRSHETRDNESKRFSRMGRWHVIAHNDLIRSYGRQEVPIPRAMPSPAARRIVPSSTFMGSRYKSFEPSVAVKEISKRKTWQSHTAASQHEQAANLEILRHLRAVGWHEGHNLWKGMTLLAKELYQFKVRGCGVKYFFVLHHFPNNVLLLWEFESAKACKGLVFWPKTSYTPNTVEQGVRPQLKAITDLLGWEAIPTNVISPLCANILHGRARSDLPRGILLHQKGPNRGIWKHAAECGFKKVPEKICRAIAEEIELEKHLSNPISSLGYVPLIVALMRHFLNPISDTKIAEILSKTVADLESPSDLLEGEDLDAMIDVKDKAEWDQERRDRDQKIKKYSLLKDEVEAWFDGEKENKKHQGRRASGSSSSSTAAGPKKVRWTALPKETAWTRDTALAFGPLVPEFSMGRTPGQGRWFATYKGRDPGYKSFSWQLWGGEDESVRLCLRWGWQQHEEVTKKPCTGEACPVAGIFV